MPFEEHRVGPRPPPGPRRSTVRIVPANLRVTSRPEFRVLDDRLEVTLSAPDIPHGRFRYVLKARYLLIWSDLGAQSQHQFVRLPKAVDAADHNVTFANGVVDLSARLRAE